MVLHGIEIPEDRIADFCRQNHIRKLALFGSILTDEFGPQSDVDVLVEFRPRRGPGFFGLMGMQDELSGILGRTVDLNTRYFLHERFRGEVEAEAHVVHAEGR